jgi:hypothetical protein
MSYMIGALRPAFYDRRLHDRRFAPADGRSSGQPDGARAVCFELLPMCSLMHPTAALSGIWLTDRSPGDSL